MGSANLWLRADKPTRPAHPHASGRLFGHVSTLPTIRQQNSDHELQLIALHDLAVLEPVQGRGSPITGCGPSRHRLLGRCREMHPGTRLFRMARSHLLQLNAFGGNSQDIGVLSQATIQGRQQ